MTATQLNPVGNIIGKLNAVGVVTGTVGAGALILNDYVLSIEEIDNGHRLIVRKGSEVHTMDVMNGTGGGPSYKIGSGLLLDPQTNTLSVNVADEAEPNNTLPITSAAVHTTVGNIEILLGTI